jgi:hypothetical protein
LNDFYDRFISTESSEDDKAACACSFLERVHDGTGMAYTGKIDYEPDEVDRIEVLERC